MLEGLSSESEEVEVVPVDDVNNNPHDNHLFSLSESSNITAHQTSNQDQAMEDAEDLDVDNLLNYEQSKEEEVTVVAKEAEVEVVKEKKKRQRGKSCRKLRRKEKRMWRSRTPAL